MGHSDNKKRNKFKVVESLRDTHGVGGKVTNVASVVCGGKFTLILTSDRENPLVLSAGHGQTGALGHGDRPTRSARRSDCKTFQIIKLLRGQRPFYLSAGSMHSAVLCGDGRAMTFGFGESGQLGRKLHGGGSSSDVPTAVRFRGKTQHNIRLCVCGGTHTLILDDDNCVWSFGSNDAGQLGLGDRRNRSLPCLVKSLLGKSDVIDMGGGLRHSAVVCEDGACYLMGAGQQGQLGISDGKLGSHIAGFGRKKKYRKNRKKNQNKTNKKELRDFLFPMLNARLSELRVVQISCGGSHTLVSTLDNFAIGDSTGEAAHSKIQRRAHAERRARAGFRDALQLVNDHGTLHRKKTLHAVLREEDEFELTENAYQHDQKKKGYKRRKKGRGKKNGNSNGNSNDNRNENGIESLKNSTVVKNFLKERKARKESYDLKTRNGTEIERDKYSSLIFPDAVDYENLNLRDYVQEIFNGVDVDNDGRLRIEMLSKAIQYNTSLVSMLASRKEVAVLSHLHGKGTELSSLDHIDLDHDGWLTVTELLTFAGRHEEEEEEIEKIRQEEMAEEMKTKVDFQADNIRVNENANENEIEIPIESSEQEIVRIAYKANKINRNAYPLRPASADQRKLKRWNKLAKKKKRPTTASGRKYSNSTTTATRSIKEGTQENHPGPYSQEVTVSDRKRAFVRLKEMFEESYLKSLASKKAHIARVVRY